jgi:hypothetical protein
MGDYSPILSIATAVIETAAAAWAFTGRGRRRFTWNAGLILLLLAGYQIAETIACADTARTTAARIGFLDILWLPAFGVLFVLQLSDLSKRMIVILSSLFFTAAVGLAFWILLEPSFVNVSVCTIVFARYEFSVSLYTIFGAYFHIGFASMLIGSAAVMAGMEDGVRRRHLADVLIGTLGFVLPAMLIDVAVPSARGAVPSIMCHLALIFALFLARIVRREQKEALRKSRS